jgi:hypothetical protein
MLCWKAEGKSASIFIVAVIYTPGLGRLQHLLFLPMKYGSTTVLAIPIFILNAGRE